MESASSALCPTCLESLVLPKNMYDEKNKHLLLFLVRILDCEIEVTNGVFNLCINCSTSLESCLNFKLNCENSLEKFRSVQNEEEPFVEKEIIFFVKDLECNDSEQDMPENIDDSLSDSPKESKSILEELLEQDINSKKHASELAIKPTKTTDKNVSVSKEKVRKSPSPVNIWISPKLQKNINTKKQKPVEAKTSAKHNSFSRTRTRSSTSTVNVLNELNVNPKKRSATKIATKSKSIAKAPKISNLRSTKNSKELASKTTAVSSSKRRQLNAKINSLYLKKFPSEVCVKAFKDCIRLFYATRQCPVCKVCYMNRHRLGVHVAIMHTEDRPNWCVKCNTLEDNIEEHNNALHKDGKALFCCPLCNRNICTAPAFRSHMTRHSATKIKLKAEWLICEHCPEIFETETQLKEHKCLNAPVETVKNETHAEKQEQAQESTDVDTGLIAKTTVSRYKKFPHEEVDKALRQTMAEFYTNRQCPICGFLTGNLTLLKLHIYGVVHKNVSDKWCAKCNILVDDLARHNEDHPPEIYFCPFCQKDLDDRYKFKIHLSYHSDFFFANVKAGWFICKKCPKSFPYEDELKQHQENECEGGASSELETTTSEAVDNTDKVDDIPEENEIKLYRPPIRTCPFCKIQVRYLSTHIKKVHKNLRKIKRPGRQESVSEGLTSKVGPREGKLTFSGKQIGRPRGPLADSFLCDYCGYKTKSITKLNKHSVTHTKDRPFQCKTCPKTFNLLKTWRDHEARHVDVRRFPCDICGKLYMSKNEVRMHKVMHETQTQECYVCQKKFCRPQLLKMHMRKHTDADKFPCTQCDAKFYIKHLLNRHVILAHTKESQYKCNYCEKEFKFVERRNNHERIHRGIKPYACSCCPYATTTSYSLTIHMRKHPEDMPMPDNPHKCDLCFKSYSTRAMLQSHNKNVHVQVLLRKRK